MRREGFVVSEKTYRAWQPDQAWLLPPSPREWLPEGHFVDFLMDAVRELDLSPITAYYERELRGYPPFHPRMLLTLLIFNSATGTRSSRKIMGRCEQDVACRGIAGEDPPDFRAISEFRRRHLGAFETLFVEVLKLAAASGLLKLGRIALDGTKIQANASRRKALSYDRMPTEEVRLQQEIRELPAQAEAEDQAEDAQHGANRRGDELPEELQRRESRLQKIRAAKAALAAESRAQAAAENAAKNAEREAAGKEPLAINLEEVRPDPQAQYNFTDPDSRILKASNQGWDQCGNAQALVDESQLILAADVTQQAHDVQQVEPLLEQLAANLVDADVTRRPHTLVADAGYYRDANTQCVKSTTSRRTSRRSACSITKNCRRRRGAGSPTDSVPSSEWPGRCGRKRAERHTRHGRARSNRCSGRSGRGVVFGSSRCGAWRRCRPNGRWCA